MLTLKPIHFCIYNHTRGDPVPIFVTTLRLYMYLLAYTLRPFLKFPCVLCIINAARVQKTQIKENFIHRTTPSVGLKPLFFRPLRYAPSVYGFTRYMHKQLYTRSLNTLEHGNIICALVTWVQTYVFCFVVDSLKRWRACARAWRPTIYQQRSNYRIGWIRYLVINMIASLG